MNKNCNYFCTNEISWNKIFKKSYGDMINYITITHKETYFSKWFFIILLSLLDFLHKLFKKSLVFQKAFGLKVKIKNVLQTKTFFYCLLFLDKVNKTWLLLTVKLIFICTPAFFLSFQLTLSTTWSVLYCKMYACLKRHFEL